MKPKAITLLIFVLTFAFALLRNSPHLFSLPEVGDGQDYDALALQLASGKGFSYDWEDPEYLEPYAGNKNYAFLLERSGAFTTTYRPPLFPLIMAGLYTSFGRSFAVIRLFNMLLFAATCALGYGHLSQRHGIFAGLVFVLLCVLHGPLLLSSGQILTESLAAFLVLAIGVVLVHYLETGSERYLVAASILMGLAILNRSILVIWILPLALFLLWTRKSIRPAAWFLSLALLTTLPWAVRNCVLLQSWMPFGTQGAINLPVAYSDLAVENRGVWFPSGELGLYDDMTSTGLDWEKDRAVIGQAYAAAWVKNNPLRLPLLAGYKVMDLWQPGNFWDAAIFILALAAAVSHWKAASTQLYAVLLAGNTAAVALTWSVGARFLIPVLPILYILAALLIGRLGKSLWDRTVSPAKLPVHPRSFERPTD